MNPGPAALGGSSRARVLFITSEPDDRASTAALRRAVEASGHRRDVTFEVWFLRAYEAPPWPGTRVVDHLRTWWPARLFSAVGLEQVAGWLRGRRLRAWFRAADPDLVVLDDGYGDRLLSSAARAPSVAIRHNPVEPRWTELEPAPRLDADLLMTALSDPGPYHAEARLPDPPPARSDAAEAAMAAAVAATAARGPVDPDEAPRVVGWGDDGWLDGPDIFVRLLWYLEDRHGIVAQGRWIGLPQDHQEQARLADEAERCGVADRFELLDGDALDERWHAGAAFLPHRVPPTVDELYEIAAGGLEVVLFAPVDVSLGWVHEVPYLDLESAAAAVAPLLVGDRRDWSGQVALSRWTDLVVTAVAERRR